MKNLTVISASNLKFKKNEIHSLVKFLKGDLNFEIESLSIVFLTDDKIIAINKSYLGHNYSTDIITFNYSGENYTLEGEIFISLEDAAFNAKKYGVDLKDEILRLIIHGFLHLVGFDDKKPADKKKMKLLENKLVNKYQNSLTKLY